MKRTTIMLPPELRARAFRYAREKGLSFGELVRESLASAMERTARRKTDRDPLFADEAVFRGAAPVDTAAEHDEHLYGPKG